MSPARRLERTWAWAFAATAMVSMLLLVLVAPLATSSEGLVKMRNALLLDAEPAMADWSPASVPADFAVDRQPAPAWLAAVIERERLRSDLGSWDTAQAIAKHLLSGGRRSSGPIKSDLTQTYERIIRDGAGYCGDYADVFTALANAAGVFSRSWAFSFDGFGGHGHIFNEVWDDRAKVWRMLDVHNNFRPTDDRGTPLSALEMRRRLAQGLPITVVLIEPSTRPGYRQPEKLFNYYRRGLPQWYLWWGANVFEYDQSPAVVALSNLGRGAEQLAGVVAGVHPRLRILAEPENVAARDALRRLKWWLISLPVAFVAMAATGVGWWSARRRRREAAGGLHA